MNDPLKDWDKLQAEWQTYQPDIQQIKKKINWVTLRMIAVLAIDVVVLVGYFPFIYYFLDFSMDNWIENSWHGVIGILLFIGVYLDFKIRLPILRMSGESTKEILAFYLKRTRAGVVIGRYGAGFSWLLLAIFTVWFAANLFLVAQPAKEFNWMFAAFGIVWISGAALLCHWYASKKQKEYLKLKQLWRDFID
ncbi:hypothetical protein FLL45_09065 [Aliikangiella marina]|uniref:Uncharacterized protein n=1 Tax=Aliikangiella marina TaxID=1712262 RepID=A0A545TD13_9GAMM|nr:hypothetical protein [Aliikangiella marina]TQV75081.1 hypothetical protein FLL45_09065 [Aliikangiella marina]